MTKNRMAFTLIEVVFVIVIIGILAAVAAPRFLGTTESARLTKVQIFVDTLNRTVAPMIWSSMSHHLPQAGGSVKHSSAAAILKYSSIYDTESTLANAIDAHFVLIPLEITISADGVTGQGTTHDIPLGAQCALSTALIGIGVGRVASAKIGDIVYNIGCIDGDLQTSMQFFLDDGTNILTK